MRKYQNGPVDELERDLLALAKERFGRNFVALVVEGSRGRREHLPDSDLDAILFLHDGEDADLDCSGLSRKYGVRIGAAVKSAVALKKGVCCIDAPRHLALCNLTRLRLRLAGARVIGGRDVISELPSVRELLRRDLIGELRTDYDYAAREDSPSNVFRREPRRHVGIIIALSWNLLLAKGIVAGKDKLPEMLRRHHPKFRVISLVKRALARRKNWNKSRLTRERRAAIRKDTADFLESYRDYVEHLATEKKKNPSVRRPGK